MPFAFLCVSQDPSGDVYDGEWENGQRHGRGEYTGVNGDKYYGEWKDGKRDGKGVFTGVLHCQWTGLEGPDGAPLSITSSLHYEGDWKGGMRHGLGTCTFACGDSYVGSFANDSPDGCGTYTYSSDGFMSGAVFRGLWFEGRRHGWGVLTFLDGRRIEVRARIGSAAPRGNVCVCIFLTRMFTIYVTG